MAARAGEGAVLRIQGERCLLRRWSKSDVSALVHHANNLNVARHLRDRFPHPYTRAHGFAFLTHAGSDDTTANLAIEVDGGAVGGIGYVRGTDIERYSAEVGYWLGEEYWNRGIATEALQLVSRHLFETVRLLRLFAVPLADNIGSARVLEKAGYQREAVMRASCVKFGEPHDQLLYARLNRSWTAPALPETRPI